MYPQIEQKQAHPPKKAFLLTSSNAEMERVLNLARGVAGTPTTVLLTGESGTGKEVIAKHIHESSTRQDAPFVAVN